MGGYGPFDEKILIEATLYGLPMYQIALAPGSQPEPVTGIPFIVQADRFVNFTPVDSLSAEAQLVSRTLVDGQFYSADGQTQFTPYRPVQPQTSVAIDYPGQVAHGVLFTGGTYQDHPGFDPVIARPLYDLRIYEPQIANEGWYPSKLENVLSLQGASGILQRLVITPGQFMTTSSSPQVTGTERLYTSLSYDLYYSISRDNLPPVIELVDMTTGGATGNFTARFSIKASDPDDPTIPDDGRVRRVIISWTYAAGDTTWESMDLQFNFISGAWIGELAGLTGAEIDFIVQAIDAAGNVGASTSKGFFFSPIAVEAGEDQTANEGDTVTLQGSIGQAMESPTILWNFGDGSTASGVLNPNHVYGDDGVYTVTLRITDGKGGSGWDTLKVAVENVAPVVTVPSAITVPYADPMPLSGSFIDPGARDIHTYRWDFSANPAGQPILTVWGNLNTTVDWLRWLTDYPAPGVYTATLTVTDDDGGVGRGSTQVTIARIDTSTAVNASVNPSILGQPVTFTATVGVNLPETTPVAPPTGTVTFADGATVLGTVPLSTEGGLTTASLSISLLSVGSHSITATYNGDSRFNGSSGSLAQAVIYQFGGFQEPIPNSNYNGGRTIPIKFTITDFNGVSIETAVAVVSVNGGPALGTASYDSTSDRYQFNLQTSGLPLGLLTITISLDDGTAYSVTVQLT